MRTSAFLVAMAVLVHGHRTPRDLADEVQSIVTSASERDNVSYSFAVGLPDGTFVSAVAGVDDRETGTVMTTASLFPAGSVAKPFLVVAALRLADPSRPVNEGGFRLDLDAFALPIVDAWLAAQGQPTFTSMWQGDPLAENFTLVSSITVRMLLSMSSGVRDYDDEALELWTLVNAPADIEPVTYLANMTHSLYFRPGEGAAYCGNGYVLAGMAIAASAGAKRWQDLDVLSIVQELLPDSEPRFENTLFMGAGPCSKHKRVVHSYGRRPGLNSREVLSAKRAFHVDGPLPRCDGTPVRFDVGVVGEPARVVNATTWEDCCETAQAIAAHEPDPLEWTFQNSTAPNTTGSCSIFSGLWFEQEPRTGALTGRVQGGRPLAPQDFYDLYGESCLNGWTMGNIAISPLDAARLFRLLADGKLLGQNDLASMMRWHNFTKGWVGMFEYGMGLVHYTYPSVDIDGNKVNFTNHWGHPGEDWGSSMAELVGYWPELNTSMALATNTIMPMNFSTTSTHNRNSGVECQLQAAVARYTRPDLPALSCSE